MVASAPRVSLTANERGAGAPLYPTAVSPGSLGMHLLVLDLRSVPASAQRFDERDLGHHLLAQQLRRQPLVAEQSALRSNHIEEARHSADIAIVGNFERPASVGHRGVLSGAALAKARSIPTARLPPAETPPAPPRDNWRRFHHRLPGVGQVGAIAAAVEDRLQQVAAERPDRIRRADQVGDVGALKSARCRKS